MKPQRTARVGQAIDLDSHRLPKRLQAENAELRNRVSALMLEIQALRERQSSVKAQPVRLKIRSRIVMRGAASR